MELNTINDVLSLLTQNKEWKERYAGYIRFLSQEQPKRFKKPEGLSVYSSVSRHKGETYDLRFDGQSVGEIASRPEEVRLFPRETANKKYFKDEYSELQISDGVDWHSTEAKKFRRFFRDKAKKSTDIKLKSPEHRVENRLLREFNKRTRAENKALTNIQPIKLNDCYFQMPTPIKASDHKQGPQYSKQYGGGIDIMERTSGRICVMEVKDENESESQADAMKQALSYATFIAALLRGKSGQEWWDFFMGRKKGVSHPMPEQLNIDVVTAMPIGETERIENAIIELKELNTIFHCHSLFYDDEEFKSGKFVFSGTYPRRLKQ